jgi:peptide/nickel transport system permease protein
VPTEPAASVDAPARWRRRSHRTPRWLELRRSWYLFLRNSLSVVGLGILLVLLAVAIYALFTPLPWGSMQYYCGTNGGPPPVGCGTVICTYPAGTPSPEANCYPTPAGYPSFVPPTVSLGALRAGPLPLGSLSVSGGSVPYFFNLFDGLVRGSDWSMFLAASIVSGGAAIGLLVGAVSGYSGGWVDEAFMRGVDVFLSIPQIVWVIMVVYAVSTALDTTALASSYLSIYVLVFAFVTIWWPFYARLVRGQVLVIREQQYVEAARAGGATGSWILRKHIVPNSVHPVLVQISLDVGTIPLLIGGMVFLGFNRLFPSQYFPEWGTVTALSVNQTLYSGILGSCELGSCVIPWWQLLFPGLALFLFAISVNLISDGIRDALDPRLRRV